jgi:hypothetical protein
VLFRRLLEEERKRAFRCDGTDRICFDNRSDPYAFQGSYISSESGLVVPLCGRNVGLLYFVSCSSRMPLEECKEGSIFVENGSVEDREIWCYRVSVRCKKVD